MVHCSKIHPVGLDPIRLVSITTFDALSRTREGEGENQWRNLDIKSPINWWRRYWRRERWIRKGCPGIRIRPRQRSTHKVIHRKNVLLSSGSGALCSGLLGKYCREGQISISPTADWNLHQLSHKVSAATLSWTQAYDWQNQANGMLSYMGKICIPTKLSDIIAKEIEKMT